MNTHIKRHSVLEDSDTIFISQGQKPDHCLNTSIDIIALINRL